MTRDYGRIVAVEIGTAGSVSRRLSSRDARGSTALQISADVTRTSEGQADQADVRVLNASDATRAALQQDGAFCRILCGLGAGPENPGGNPAQLLAGRVVPASIDGPRKSGGNTLLTWTVTDGGFDLADVTIAQSWRGPVRVSQIIDEVIGSSGLLRGAVVLGDPAAQFRTGFTAHGRLRDVLDQLAVRVGSRVSIQHGAVEMWALGAPRPGQGYIVTPESGLVEPPSRLDKRRWSVRSILLSGLRPGDALTVRSDSISGTMVADDARHSVDSHDGAWETVVAGTVTQ